MDTHQPRFGFRAGFRTGIGFGIGLIAILLIYDWVSDYMKKNVAFSEAANVVVTEHELQREPFNASVIGIVQNKGQNSWRYVRLRVELQDANGRFVDLCTDSLDGTLRPGQAQHFKVTCNGSKGRPLVKFEKYSVVVSDAYVANER
jgi:hypothetical protein